MVDWCKITGVRGRAAAYLIDVLCLVDGDYLAKRAKRKDTEQ